MKRFLFIFLSSFFLSGCTSKMVENKNYNTANPIATQKVVESTKESGFENIALNNINEEAISSAKKYDFITSFDGNQCSVQMLSFAKSYFNSDIDNVKSYLLESEDKEINFLSNENRNFSDIKYILIKGLVFDEKTGIASAQLEYSWDDVNMNYYIDITMKKVNDVWKVIEFNIEA